MLKYGFRLACVLVILFISVPFLISLDTKQTYSLSIGQSDIIYLEMPDGELISVTKEEYFIGAAAAFMPEEADAENIRAAYVMLNTPELLESGVIYLSEEQRTELWGDSYSEKSALYSEIFTDMKTQSLALPSDSDISLFECMEALPKCKGTYTEKLAVLFPGGGIKTQK